jgi:hypothetical protein
MTCEGDYELWVGKSFEGDGLVYLKAVSQHSHLETVENYENFQWRWVVAWPVYEPDTFRIKLLWRYRCSNLVAVLRGKQTWGPVRSQRRTLQLCHQGRHVVAWILLFSVSTFERKRSNELFWFSILCFTVSTYFPRVALLASVWIQNMFCSESHVNSSWFPKFSLNLSGWCETESTWYVGYYLAYCTSPRW